MKAEITVHNLDEFKETENFLFSFIYPKPIEITIHIDGSDIAQSDYYYETKYLDLVSGRVSALEDEDAINRDDAAKWNGYVLVTRV